MSQRLPAIGAPPPQGVGADIDWSALVEQRQAVLRHSDMPPYLLRPEIHRLLDAVERDNHRLLLDTLWHTGARISECLALTRADFVLDARLPYASIPTLKKRGRPSRRKQHARPRLVPLADAAYIRSLQRYFASHSLRKNERIWPVTRDAVNKRLHRLSADLVPPPSVKVTPHVFRHSFAVNAVLHGIPLPVLQAWLGHADINSTLVYTQVLALETHHLMRRIAF